MTREVADEQFEAAVKASRKAHERHEKCHNKLGKLIRVKSAADSQFIKALLQHCAEPVGEMGEPAAG